MIHGKMAKKKSTRIVETVLRKGQRIVVYFCPFCPEPTAKNIRRGTGIDWARTLPTPVVDIF
jgi:hypothetical protein